MNPYFARLGWRFWLITLAALATMAITASLGRWQLSRAAQKEALQTAIDTRGAMAPVDAAALQAAAATPEGAEPLLHRQAVLTGHWVAQATVFLDNRQMQGRPGFFVVTPLRLEGAEGAAVLVQRGWVPRDFQERTRLPDIATPDGPVQIAGRIAAAPSRLYELGTPGAGAGQGGAGASRIRQNLDLAAFALESGLALAPLTVLQTGNASDGLRRDWPAIDSGVDKHYGYAFQWFGLCALVAILYVWFQIIRRFLRPRRQPAA